MLTPEEIFEKEFKRSLRGYDIDEVNEFLDQIINDFSRLLDENKALKKENLQLKNSTNRQTFHSGTGNDKNLIEDLVRRVEILEKKTKFL